MGRSKRMTDEEFIATVAQYPNAQGVAQATGYSVGGVHHKMVTLREKGHTVEYGSALSEPTTDEDGHIYDGLDYIPTEAEIEHINRAAAGIHALIEERAAAEEPTFQVVHACTNCGCAYSSDTLEQGICPDCKRIDRCMAAVTTNDIPEEGYDADYDEAFAQGWNDAMLYFFGETGTGDNKMYRHHRDALLMNEGFDWGVAQQRHSGSEWHNAGCRHAQDTDPYAPYKTTLAQTAAFADGYAAGDRDARNSTPARDTELERELLLDKFPVWNDGWLAIVQVEWLRTWLEVWRGAQP